MTTVKLEGFKALDDALDELSKAAGKGVLRRSLLKSADKMVKLMASRAPRDTGGLAESIDASTKLDKRQSRMHRKAFRNDKSSVEVFVGPSYNLGAGGRHGHLLEFGTYKMAPQPFVRPAWDEDRGPLLDRLGKEMATELEKSVARARRKAAKGA